MIAESITLTNNSTKTIQIITTQDNLCLPSDRKKVLTIPPKESFVIFTERVESLLWEKGQQ